MTQIRNSLLCFGFFILFGLNSYSQEIDEAGELIGQEKSYNPIQTAVPFLTIAPDSRAGAMGEVGAATRPDVNSMNYNPAKYAFLKDDVGLGISFVPWLRKLVHDMYIGYVTGYYKLDDMQTIAGSLRYFTLGSIEFTDKFGTKQQDYTPNEFAITAAYSRLFSEQFAGSLAFRFIHSNLTGGYSNSGGESGAGISYAADVSAYYENDIDFYDKDATLSFGMNISNIGTKMSYTGQTDEFIPVNLRLGSALRINLDQYNALDVAVDLNKLLVPTPPQVYEGGEVKPNGDTASIREIQYGMDPDVSLVEGIIQSFYDAPGVVTDDGDRSVFREELQEIIYNVGLEYWYLDQFALRAGYFHEHQRKGNRKFFTAGMGIKLNVVSLDFSYLMPVYAQSNPLANTVRFSLTFDVGAMQEQ
jgi:hypothetical protein